MKVELYEKWQGGDIYLQFLCAQSFLSQSEFKIEIDLENKTKKN